MGFEIGQRVRFTNWHEQINGTEGIVVEHVDTTDTGFAGRDDLYRVRDDNDAHPEWPARLTFANEMEAI